ncbi:VWA domain-containing protein [Rasiella rasia]|uniref:VWA domain-containing protein n=1 Tax=Rasiella rasia TaxID=2744027 RepID=A0A6G6GIE1_9FLAO|nr:VWA domain-containing protein [Rasiella rasia]QIE58356.1 VWA domain-containing protein [Rasiella rasia]
MSPETILYIVIAGVASFALAVFMYGYRSRYKGSMSWVFGILRFVTLFSILLLLINPKFKSETYTIEKPKLPILVDNSASVTELEQADNANSAIEKLKANAELNDKYDLSFFTFGNSFIQTDSVSFAETNTNITKALAATNEVFKNEIAPTILISDGNQTLGNDYEFASATFANPIYPIILGDSTRYTDLKIERLNTNRYAFLKNKFPVEAILVYNGTGSETSQFVITQGAATVYRETVTFSENDNTKTISLTLPASRVGLQTYTASIVPLEIEKNTVNNRKRFAVEVIDEATNVLVVSAMVHPDLGAIKKSIETNEQRKVRIVKPSEAVSLLNDFQLVVLYQPNRSFNAVYTELAKLKKNTLLITGSRTDWSFLNVVQPVFRKDETGQKEDAAAQLNVNYGTFAVEDIGFTNFPPLETSFGDLVVTIPHEKLLLQTVAGIETGNPMIATAELNGKRDAIWDVEGIWKWRAQSYLQENNFQEFDNFMGKLVQYLASNKRKSRLEVSSESFYYNNSPIKISAQYFDKNYVFDGRASLNISVVNKESSTRTVFPLLLKNNFYEVDVNSLPAGSYSYTVSVGDETIARSGNFTILDFNVEQQFGNANVTKLGRLATNTNGTPFFTNQVDNLITVLLEDERFQSIQKSEEKVVPLIDWKYLLILIVLALSAEWFIRKYNGLI